MLLLDDPVHEKLTARISLLGWSSVQWEGGLLQRTEMCFFSLEFEEMSVGDGACVSNAGGCSVAEECRG